MKKFLETVTACRRIWTYDSERAADQFARFRGYKDAADLLAAEARATGTLLIPRCLTAAASE